MKSKQCKKSLFSLIAVYSLAATLPTTATPLVYGTLSASGKNQIELFFDAGKTNNLHISGGTFAGFDGGIANDAQYLENHPDALIRQITSHGGSGAYLQTHQLIINPTTPVSFTGGNGGTAIGTASASDVSANGGSGASISSTVNIFGSSQRNSITAFSPVNTGILSSSGSGIHVPYNPVIRAGTFYGGTGGNVSDPGSSAGSLFASGGDGATLESITNSLISGGSYAGGTFTGGNSGIAVSAEDTPSHIEILGGSFQGGNGGVATGNQNVWALGGAGFFLSSSTNLSISDARFKGGDGGTAIKPNADDRLYTVDASGGDGFHSEDHTYSSQADTIIQNSHFKGGNAGNILFTNSQDRVGGVPNATGGHGIRVLQPYGDSLRLTEVSATGGDGGTISVDGEIAFGVTSGGDGAHIKIAEVVIDGGTYKGGSAGSSLDPSGIDTGGNNVSTRFGLQPPKGGAGARITAEHATISGGTFEGGTDANNRKSAGLIFQYARQLDIRDGNFNAYDPSADNGLEAIGFEQVNIYGGTFNSIYLRGEGSFNFSSIHISSNALITGKIILSEGIRIPHIESGTYQNTDIVHGSVRLEDNLTLQSGAQFKTDGVSFLSADHIHVESNAKLHIGSRADFNGLNVKKDGTLELSSITEYSAPEKGWPPYLKTLERGRIWANEINFQEGSKLTVVPFNTSISIGQTQYVANVAAYEINIYDGVTTNPISQEDIDKISEIQGDHLLTSYDFILLSETNLQQILLAATGVKLSQAKNNPLPPHITTLIDNNRDSSSHTASAYSLAAEDAFRNILYYIDHPEYRDQFRNEIKQYFNTAAAPMALKAVQAGQQAQLNQILGHTQAARSAPAGAAGPSETNRDWAGWIKGYGTDATKDPDADYPGYDANIAGIVFGIEKTGENTLVGVAGGSSRTDVDTDERGSSDVETYFGSFYASFGDKSTFIDTSLSYGHNQVDSKRGSITPSTAQYNAHNLTGYIGGGRQYQINQKLSFTPELGGQLCYYFQEGFTETGVLNNTYEDYDYWYFQSILGAKTDLKLPAGDALVCIPELRLHWNHNFNPAPDRISYTTDATGSGATAGIQSPEEDTLIIGAGLTTMIRDRLDIGLRIDQQLADGWESTIYSGSLKIRF